MPSSTKNGPTGMFQNRTQSLFMCFWGERRLGVRLRRARGLMGRDEGKIATSRFRSLETCKSSWRRAGLFFKGNGIFWLSILCDVYLFIINNKKVSKKYFYAFSGILVVSPVVLVRGKLRIPYTAKRGYILAV